MMASNKKTLPIDLVFWNEACFANKHKKIVEILQKLAKDKAVASAAGNSWFRQSQGKASPASITDTAGLEENEKALWAVWRGFIYIFYLNSSV